MLGLLFLLGCCSSILMLTLFVRYAARKSKPVTFKNRHVAVVGGSEGIGWEIARICSKEGARAVTLMARRRPKLETAKARLEKELRDCALDCTVDFEPCDVTDSRIVQTAFANARKRYGPVEVLINAAGCCVADAADVLTAEEFEGQVKLNLLGSIYTTRQVIDDMKVAAVECPDNSPCIVFIASVAAQVGFYGISAYSASKFGLRGFVDSLSMELDPYGIFVALAFPPNTDTPGFEKENLRKPEITSFIEGSPGILSAETVAKAIVKAVKSGRRRVTFLFLGGLLDSLTVGFSPAEDSSILRSFWCLLRDMTIAPLARFVAVSLLTYWRLVVDTHHTTATNREALQKRVSLAAEETKLEDPGSQMRKHKAA